jgi:hypothetical protein
MTIEDDQAEKFEGWKWQKNEGASRNATQRPTLTSSWPSTRKVGPASGSAKTGPYRIPNRTVQFP